MSKIQTIKKKHPLYYYFRNILDGIISIYKGMKLTAGYIFKKPVTITYPEQPIIIPEGYRGVHTLEDESSCTACLACSKICPTNCIAIDSVGTGDDALLTKFEVDLSKCSFCGMCEEACTPNALKFSTHCDIATPNKSDTIINLIRIKGDLEIMGKKGLS